MKIRVAAVAVVLMLGSLTARAAGKTFVAYSLRQAENRMAAGNREVTELGGITEPVAFVYDAVNDDYLLVGVADPKKPPVTLESFVAALRATMLFKELPEVSIDPPTAGSDAHLQPVLFRGRLEDTRLGMEMLEADIALKKLALGMLHADIWGVRSYLALSVDEARNKGSLPSISSRFWLRAGETRVSGSERDGVMVVQSCKLRVDTEVITSEQGKQDLVGENFSSQVAASFPELVMQYPALARVLPILRLVALAEGISRHHKGSNLDFWLNQYQMPKTATPRTYELAEARQDVPEMARAVVLSGGIDTNPLIIRLNAGDATALREVVLKSRPSPRAVVWHPSLDRWDYAGEDSVSGSDQGVGSPDGFYLRARTELLHSAPTTSVPGGSGGLRQPYTPAPRPAPMTTQPLPVPKPQGAFNNPALPNNSSAWKLDHPSSPPTPYVTWTPPRTSNNVGGVMLSGVAKVGDGAAKVDLADGNFSLIVDGENARLDPRVFRQFVTALWAVYFGRQDPGISIDPISMDPTTGSFGEKHLVRYIGRVVNTDLGRVMRDADYQMKKWAVGTERAEVSGFKSPDEIAGSTGTRYLSLSRFWLVPEDMRFKSADNMLLFDRGRMTVKTEVIGSSIGEKQADPDNERFARFFTAHYAEIAAKYPVYQELFDYAKLVGLAKYLRESGVPLYWFLMANKDLVLTEDSPGTVNNLAKGSSYWQGLTIQGGVDLATNGQYVYDASAVKAIGEAMQKAGVRSSSTSLADSRTQTLPLPFSFGLGDERYSVAPQHSMSSGKDRYGNLYQTDLALRAEGYLVTQDLLDTLRAEMIRQRARRLVSSAVQGMPEAELSVKLTSLVSSALERSAQEMEPLLQRLQSLRNREFKTEAECGQAWDDVAGTREAAEWRPFFVQQAHYVSNLELTRYFNPRLQEHGEFGKGWRLLVPYRIKPAGQTAVKFLNVPVHKQMQVENLLSGNSETLTFSADRYKVAGYVPDKLEGSQFVGLFLLSDASFRLVDKMGSEFEFDPAGYLTDLELSDDYRIHIEYADDISGAFQQKPYSIEPAGVERIPFLNVRIPKSMIVKDLIHNQDEVLNFSEDGEIAGYVPAYADKSRYKILALLSDASFQLMDREGSVASFTPSGEFDRMAVGVGRRVPKSISMGNYEVSFDYTTDPTGGVLIANGLLARKTAGAFATHTVSYEYDAEGRLSQAKRQSTQAPAARNEEPGDASQRAAAKPDVQRLHP